MSRISPIVTPYSRSNSPETAYCARVGYLWRTGPTPEIASRRLMETVRKLSADAALPPGVRRIEPLALGAVRAPARKEAAQAVVRALRTQASWCSGLAA